MNKKLVISMGIAVAMSATMAAFADTTINTDSIGRIHFLGRDAANGVQNGTKYSNSAEQDLTRKLYEKSASEAINDTSYDQHPLKNYENTFPDSRFGSFKGARAKENELPEEMKSNSAKGVVSATKGATDYSGQYQFYDINTNTQNDKNVVKTKAKKHWWNRNK